MQLNWQCLAFNSLTTKQLYKILQVRNEVFVVEQNCVYNDVDNKDQYCHHLIAFDETDNIMAYCRLIPANISYKNYASIGRVLTDGKARQFGIGKQLMQIALEHCAKLFINVPIKIGAQLYLKKFYEGFGFVICSEVYLEDGIEHIEMILES